MQRMNTIKRPLLWAASFAILHTLVVGILYFGKAHPIYPYLDPMIFGVLLCVVDLPLVPAAIKWFNHAPDPFVSYYCGGILYGLIGLVIGSYRQRRTTRRSQGENA